MHAFGVTVSLASLSKRFELRGRRGGVTALDDVTLEIGPGVTAVVGPNGAGKSTLLALVLGFLHPTSGAVRISGDEPRVWLRREGAGYLPERFRLPAAWTVRDALQALVRADGVQPTNARVGDWLDRLDLAGHADKPLGALSRGLLQRFGIAQALAAGRALLVLDEPTEGLDPVWRLRFRAILTRLASEGRTIVLASHALGEVERVASRVVVLDAGRVRELIDVAREGAGVIRRLQVERGAEHVLAAFPRAVAEDDARSFIVSAPSASQLSAGLAALLAAGATVSSVEPVGSDLEARFRRQFGGSA